MTGVMCAPRATMGAVGTSLPAARGRVAGRKVPAGAKGGAVVRGRRSSRGVRVRAAGGGLFGAASAVNTQEIAAKITEIKETELELSRGIWRAVDAATAAATDAVRSRALEERLAEAELELEAEQAGRREAAEEQLRLEEELAAAQKDLASALTDSNRAETAAFTMSRRLAAALRAQSNSAKLIARLRKS